MFLYFRALLSLLLDLLLENLDVVCQSGDGGLKSLVNGLVSKASQFLNVLRGCKRGRKEVGE